VVSIQVTGVDIEPILRAAETNDNARQPTQEDP
jgi:hypothetical protein